MRKTLTFICLAAMTLAATAQPKGYKFTYQEKVNFNANSRSVESSDVDPAMIEMVFGLVSQMKNFYTLTYANGKSLYEKDRNRSDSDFGSDNSENVIFVDFANNEVTKVVNFFGRTFNIRDTMTTHQWQITDETKEIAGLHCTKATTGVNDSTSIVVWFSKETPIPAGPQEFYGLPGLICEVNVGKMTTYTLTDIEVLDKDPDLKRPTKGKSVTAVEYKEIIDKKMKEMRMDIGTDTPSDIRVIRM